MQGLTVVVIGGNPGQQLKTFDAARPVPPAFEPADQNEMRLWRELALASDLLQPGDPAELLLKLLQDAGVRGLEDAMVLGGRIGRMSTVNPQGRFEKAVFDRLPRYFLHRNGTHTSRITAGDLDLDGMRAERREQGHRRYREFSRLTMGIPRAPRPQTLARKQIERGLTFTNAIAKAQRMWLNHPWVEAVYTHRWAPDTNAPQRGGDNFWFNCGVLANEGDPWLAFCCDFPDPEAEFVRRESLAVGVPWTYVVEGRWHQCDENVPEEAVYGGQAALDYRESWFHRVQDLYTALPPATRLTAVLATF